jgi:hypothetical protein
MCLRRDESSNESSMTHRTQYRGRDLGSHEDMLNYFSKIFEIFKITEKKGTKNDF